jgi:phosphoglycerol geranylgeranyltransferase
MRGKVENYLRNKIKRDGSIHMTLIDPEKTKGIDFVYIAEEAEKGGTSAIMVGGSTIASNLELDRAVRKIKEKIELPVILFPNGPQGITPKADAIWFMSLLNSTSPYYLVDCQALTAPVIKRYGLEVLPMAYIIIGSGGAAGYVGQIRRIPLDHPEIVLGYSMAAELFGMRYVYLEAGSGAKSPVHPETIKLVDKYIKVPLIVGGGIRNPETAVAASKSGADIIVTGNIVEERGKIKERIWEIVQSIKS